MLLVITLQMNLSFARRIGGWEWMTTIYMDYLLRVRHLGNIHAASVLPHNQVCFHATDRVTQSQHPPVRLHLVSRVSLWALCSSRDERPWEQGSNSWPKGSFGEVMLTYWEDNRECGRLVACRNLSMKKTRRQFLKGCDTLLGPR